MLEVQPLFPNVPESSLMASPYTYDLFLFFSLLISWSVPEIPKNFSSFLYLLGCEFLLVLLSGVGFFCLVLALWVFFVSEDDVTFPFGPVVFVGCVTARFPSIFAV